MGYSGYEVIMCKNGHHECVDSFDYITDSVCEYCDELSRSVGSVDCTNGSPYFLDFELHQKTPDVQVHCPVCDKVHKRTEGTYEFKKVEIYESEKDDYIKTTMDTVHNVSEEACSEFCDLHRKMKSTLGGVLLWVFLRTDKVDESSVQVAEILKKHEDGIHEQVIAALGCCGKGYELQELTVGCQSVSLPHCKECGELMTFKANIKSREE